MGAVTLIQKWQLLQAIIEDDALSLKAKVVAARLLHHHNTQTSQCTPSYDTLARGAGFERRSAIRAVEELEKSGWIRVSRVNGGASNAAKGFVTNSFMPCFSRLESGHPPVSSQTLPPGVQPDTGGSAQPDTTPVSSQTPPGVSSQTPKQEKGETGKGNRESPPTPSPFAEFWDAYPKQEGEDAARREYDRVLKDQRATHHQIMEGVTAYAAAREGEPAQYTTSPGRWLKDGRWRDRPTPATLPRRGGFSATRDWLPARMDVDE